MPSARKQKHVPSKAMIHVFLICVKLCKSGLYNVVTKKEVDYVHSLTRSLLTGLRSFTSHKTIHRIVLFGRVPSARKQKHVPSKAMIHVFLICVKLCKSGLYNVVTKKEVDYVHSLTRSLLTGLRLATAMALPYMSPSLRPQLARATSCRPYLQALLVLPVFLPEFQQLQLLLSTALNLQMLR